MAGNTGVEHDAVAHVHLGHRAAHLTDDARPVTTQRVRKIEIQARETAESPEIEVIERGRLERYHNLVVRSERGFWEVDQCELVEASVRAHGEGLHDVGNNQGRLGRATPSL